VKHGGGSSAGWVYDEFSHGWHWIAWYRWQRVEGSATSEAGAIAAIDHFHAPRNGGG
jgi:hypothetical protein